MILRLKKHISLIYLFKWNDVDIDKIMISDKVSCGERDFKCFIEYKDDVSNILKPLCIMLPKMSGFDILMKLNVLDF